MTNNPYQAPSSDVNNTTTDEMYQPKLFTIQGRIGRLRYLAYSMLGMLAFIPALVVLIASGSLAGSLDGEGLGVFAWIIMGLSYLVVLVWTFVLAKRRFNDFNLTGWLSLTYIIPIVSLVTVLALLFVPGTKTSNKYGPRPAANSTAVKIVAGLVILVTVLGIVAAVVTPALTTLQ